jgi:hypothetical protein
MYVERITNYVKQAEFTKLLRVFLCTGKLHSEYAVQVLRFRRDGNCEATFTHTRQQISDTEFRME